MEKNDKNANIKTVKNVHINSYTSPIKDIIGILLTENFPNSDNLVLALVKRNELIAALSDAIIVVESSESGGAHYAIDYGKKLEKLVITMEPQVKNDEFVNGFQKFVEQGAKPAKTAKDVKNILD